MNELDTIGKNNKNASELNEALSEIAGLETRINSLSKNLQVLDSKIEYTESKYNGQKKKEPIKYILLGMIGVLLITCVIYFGHSYLKDRRIRKALEGHTYNSLENSTYSTSNKKNNDKPVRVRFVSFSFVQLAILVVISSIIYLGYLYYKGDNISSRHIIRVLIVTFIIYAGVSFGYSYYKSDKIRQVLERFDYYSPQKAVHFTSDGKMYFDDENNSKMDYDIVFHNDEIFIHPGTLAAMTPIKIVGMDNNSVPQELDLEDYDYSSQIRFFLEK